MNSRSPPANATGSSLLAGRKPVNYNDTVNEYNNINNNNSNDNSNNNSNDHIHKHIRKHHIEDVSSLCRMCGKFDETIAHIVAESPSLVPNHKQL